MIIKPIKEFEGYGITIDGKVWSFKTHKWLKQQDSDGYCYLYLRINNKQKYIGVHRLVAMTFLDNSEKKKAINHKDFNRKNNNVDNLEWVTDSENSKYSYNNGRRKNQREIAIRNGKKMCKFNSQNISQIKELYSRGYTQKLIAKIYKVHRETISRIIRNKTYCDKHIKKLIDKRYKI